MMFARKRDENEKPIVDALTAMGASVTRLNDFGCPDLLVAYRGRTLLIEVKNPSKSSKPSRAKEVTEDRLGKLTDTQVKWWNEWNGGEVYIVETPEQAVAAVRGSDSPVGVFLVQDDNPPWCMVGMAPPPPFMTPEQADALAGALHELAQVARAKQRERQRLL